MTGTCIGRVEHLAEADRALNSLSNDRGGVTDLRLFGVRGQPGIGKSAVAEEIERRAAEREFFVIRGRAFEGIDLPPYALWIPIVGRLAEIGAAADEMHATEYRNAYRAARGAAGLADATDRLRDPKQALIDFTEAVATLFRLASRSRPILCTVDDLHRADELSIRLFQLLMDRLASLPVLFIAAWRSSESAFNITLESTIQELERYSSVSIRNLEPLNTEEVAEFVRAFAAQTEGETQPDPAQLAEESGGHPLLLRWLLDSDAREGSLSYFVRTRRASLDHDERTLLDRLALYGYEFDLPVAEALLPDAAAAGARDPNETLTAFCEALLLRRLGPNRFDFFHEMVRNEVLTCLTTEEKETGHSRIAHALSETRPVPEEQRDLILADHLLSAGSEVDISAGIEYARRAAYRAARAAAWEDALAVWRRLESLPSEMKPSALAAEIDYNIAKSILYKPIEYPERYQACTYLSRALRTQIERRDIDSICEIVTTRRSTHEAEYVALVREAVALVPPTHPMRPMVMASYAWGAYECGMPSEAIPALDEAEAGAEEQDLHHVRARVNHIRGEIATYVTGHPAEGRRHASEALRLLTGTEHHDDLAWIYACLADSHWFLGEIDQAEALIRKSIEEFDKVEDKTASFLADASLLRYALARGEWDTVFSYDKNETALTSQHIITAYYLTGRIEEGDACLDSLSLKVDNDPEMWMWFAFSALVAVRVRRQVTGESAYCAAARSWAGRIFALRRELLSEAFGAGAHLTLARIAFDENDRVMLDRSLRGIERFLRVFHCDGMYVEEIAVEEGRGVCNFGQGRLSRAATHFEKALEWCEFSQDRPAAAVMRAQLSDVERLREHRAEAERHAAAALRTARELGMRPLVNRLEATPPKTDLVRSLSAREVEVLRLVAQGRSDKEIGSTLNISAFTVGNHVRRVLDKVQAASRAEAVSLCVQAGVLAAELRR